MGDAAAKAALYDSLSEAAKALSSGRRAELIDVLAQGERSVEELAEEIGQTVANTSQHLQRLLRSGLVKSRRDGNAHPLFAVEPGGLHPLADDAGDG